MHAKAMKQLPPQLPLDLIIRRLLQIYEAEVWLSGMSVLVHEKLQSKGLVLSAKQRFVPCLSSGAHLLLFRVLNLALSQHASVEPANRFPHKLVLAGCVGGDFETIDF